jgi:serine/threonine-protein kinase OSR1/STK39
MTEYELLTQLGHGAFSTVHLAIHKETREPFTIKVIDLTNEKTKITVDDISKEVTILRMLSHENLITLKESIQVNNEVWIVMPYMEFVLKNILKAHPKGIKDEIFIATVLYEVLKGLEYLHKNYIIHRDLKASNILISCNGTVKLCDFGVAGKLIEGGIKSTRHTLRGTIAFMAPEVMETEDYDSKVDIWSFGILALELAFGYAPYEHCELLEAIIKTIKDDPPTIDLYDDKSYKFSKSFIDLFTKCLKKNPKDRPSASKLLKHKFFKLRKDAVTIIEKAKC